jgi:hypothetical protein
VVEWWVTTFAEPEGAPAPIRVSIVADSRRGKPRMRVGGRRDAGTAVWA